MKAPGEALDGHPSCACCARPRRCRVTSGATGIPGGGLLNGVGAVSGLLMAFVEPEGDLRPGADPSIVRRSWRVIRRGPGPCGVVDAARRCAEMEERVAAADGGRRRPPAAPCRGTPRPEPPRRGRTFRGRCVSLPPTGALTASGESGRWLPRRRETSGLLLLDRPQNRRMTVTEARERLGTVWVSWPVDSRRGAVDRGGSDLVKGRRRPMISVPTPWRTCGPKRSRCTRSGRACSYLDSRRYGSRLRQRPGEDMLDDDEDE